MEAYVGEYASGKSEIAINRALELKNQGRQVTLVDLDTVEPFFTLRPLKEMLEKKGLKVVGFSREDSFGLGETGAMLNPQARWALMNEGDVILDIGYGVFGARTLNLVEGVGECPELQVLAVINQNRPMTGSLSLIKEYLCGLGRVDGIVANSHLGQETTAELMEKGNYIILQAALQMDLPVVFMAAEEKWRRWLEQKNYPFPVKYIKRYMPGALW